MFQRKFCLLLMFTIVHFGAMHSVYGQHFDLVLRGGTVIDGSGVEPRVADVGIRAGMIVAVEAKLKDGDMVIDCLLWNAIFRVMLRSNIFS